MLAILAVSLKRIGKVKKKKLETRVPHDLRQKVGKKLSRLEIRSSQFFFETFTIKIIGQNRNL